MYRYKHPAAKYNETTPDVTDFREAFPETGRVGCHDPDCFPAYARGFSREVWAVLL